MRLPPPISQALADPNGGKLALVLGAGCSFDPPTSIPLSREVSIDLHTALVDDGILQEGECTDPSDLSEIADVVFAKHQSQREVILRLKRRFPLQIVAPNVGYLVAAALLYEGVVSSIVTLNYDLALSSALMDLGADKVGVIQGPADLSEQKSTNLYYLHRNANTENLDEWILRTAALMTEWREHWEPIVAGKVLASPIVVFAGLGTPIRVLIESTKRLRTALPNQTSIYLVGRGRSQDSKFFAALALEEDSFLQSNWAEHGSDVSTPCEGAGTEDRDSY